MTDMTFDRRTLLGGAVLAALSFGHANEAFRKAGGA